MKIVLISPYPDVTAFGLRTISAHLRRHGHRTRLIFVPDLPDSDPNSYTAERYPAAVLDELAGLCRDADLIGISLMTDFFDSAVQITRRVKAAGVKAPVIWGGVHPTIRPEESLGHADIVCVGDGEDALLELADRMAAGRECAGIGSLWFRRPEGIEKNPVRPLCRDLDAYPAPDYSLEDHHVLSGGSIVPLAAAVMQRSLEHGVSSRLLGKTGYQTMTGRGCPHKCTYCINDTLKNIYGGQNYLRWRSTDHVMQELSWVREHLPYVGAIWISDDAFFARSAASIEEFCRAYKEKIGLPFTCLASPLTLTEEKMRLLVDAGLVYVQMGIQSGSAKTQELFNRKQMSNERVLKATRILNSYKDRMFPPSYDFILDVPYESGHDVVESLRLVARIPKPFRLQPFPLILYPGTRISEMAKSDGFLEDERRQAYANSHKKREVTYLNILMIMASGGRFPGPLLRLLVSPPVVALFDSVIFRPLFAGARALMRFRSKRARSRLQA